MSLNELDAWFAAAPAAQLDTLAALRELVKSAAPGIVEELKWSRPIYSNERGMFCYLHSTKNHATLGFHNGTALKDPKGLLEGTGKGMRHIKFKGMSDVNKPAVVALLKQAVAM